MNVSFEKGDRGGLPPTYIETNVKLEQSALKMFARKIFRMNH